MPCHAAKGARAIIAGRTLDDTAIDELELARARHALAYLQDKIGKDAMRDLLEGDVAVSSRRGREWVRASEGRWKSAQAELTIPDLTAARYDSWFRRVVASDREADLRAGHPEHFLTISAGGAGEVIETLGHGDLPWSVRLEFAPADAVLPASWDPNYPAAHRVGLVHFDDDGLQVATTMHESRDTADGLQFKITVILPEQAPDALLDGHLHHLAIEARNWARLAKASG